MTDKLSPQKRIQLLKEFEEEKKKELEKLKKQQEKEEQELKETRNRLEDSIEALEEETEFLSEQAEEEHKKEEEKEVRSIDELAVQAPHAEIAEHISYDGLDKLKAESLYELTDYNTYNELKRLEGKAYLSREEQDRLQTFQSQLNTLQDSYSQDQITNLDQLRGGYISRTENILQKLHEKMHDLNQTSDYSQGEYRW